MNNVLGLLLAIINLALPTLANASPAPPCAGAPVPAYAAPGRAPNVQVWNSSAIASWAPPSCLGWSGDPPNLVVAIAGTTAGPRSADDLLKLFGAVSALQKIRYWSVTDKTWRDLIGDAWANHDARDASRRVDFDPDELKRGQRLYFTQKDARLGDESTYSLHVREVTRDRIVIEMENMTAMRALFISVAAPGAMKSLYFLDRRSDGLWNAYAMLVAKSSYAERNEASFVNRTMAFYRHYMGLPTDSSPPAAP